MDDGWSYVSFRLIFDQLLHKEYFNFPFIRSLNLFKLSSCLCLQLLILLVLLRLCFFFALFNNNLLTLGVCQLFLVISIKYTLPSLFAFHLNFFFLLLFLFYEIIRLYPGLYLFLLLHLHFLQANIRILFQEIFPQFLSFLLLSLPSCIVIDYNGL